MRHLITSARISIVAAMLAPQIAHAQSTPPANPDPALASSNEPAVSPPAAGGVGDIIVTAQRRSEKLKNVPLTVTSLSRAELTRSGTTSIQNLGTLVSGFTNAGSGGFATPAIRGVTTSNVTFGNESPNAVYIDGVYNASFYTLAHDYFDIDRIEVLKGPQGTLFGRNATGGAIQIFTKNPSFTPHADISIEEGAYVGSGSSRSSNHFKVSAFATLPIIDDLVAVSISGGASRTEGYFTNDSTGGRDGLDDTKSVRGKILITPASNLTIQVTGFYLRNQNASNGLLATYKGLAAAIGQPGVIVPTKPWHTAYSTYGGGNLFGGSASDVISGEPSNFYLRQYGGNLKVALQLDPGTITSLTAYTKTPFKFPIFTAGGGDCPVAVLAAFRCIVAQGSDPQREFSQEVNFISREFGIFDFTAGAYYYHNSGSAVGYLQFGIPAQISTFDTKSYAGYGEVTVKPIDRLSVIAGLRYTADRQRDFDKLGSPGVPFTAKNNKWTPRISVRYEVTPDLNAYATYSIGYKSGLTGALNSGRTLLPEKLTSYEAGLKYGSHDLSANISFFYYDWKNLQVSNPDLSSGAAFNARNADARLYGLDGDFTYALSQAWRARATVSWLPHSRYTRFPNASYATTEVNPATGLFYNSDDLTRPNRNITFPTDLAGTRLIRSPKVTASGTISYDNELGNGEFDASATVTYSASFNQELARVNDQHAYAVLSAQAGYKFGDGPLRIGVYGRNLANKHYQNSANTSVFGFQFTYAAPRELGLTLGYSF